VKWDKRTDKPNNYMPPLYYCMEDIKIPHHENYVIAYAIPTYNVDTYINLIKNKKNVTTQI